jgi:hypothetical protein
VIWHIPELATDANRALARPGTAYLAPADYQDWLPRNNDYAHRPNVQKFVDAIRRQFALQSLITRKLSDAGVLLVSGTDAPDNCLPGEALHEELGLLVAAGLTRYAALRTATFNPGIFVAAKIRAATGDRFGVIAPGARADLILVDSNPLENLDALDRISGSMVAGQWRKQGELAAARAQIGRDMKAAHARVDAYERLWTSGDVRGVIALLDRTPAENDAPFSDLVLSADALSLAKAGRGADAITLLHHTERLLPESIAIPNTLGLIASRAGATTTAAAAFRDTLKIAPHDAVALQGLNEIH